MLGFFALVDAVPGREDEVEAGLRREPRVLQVARCKDGNFDFLIRVEAESFSTVDDVLQTYVRAAPGVAGVEVVRSFSEHSESVREAHARLVGAPPSEGV